MKIISAVVTRLESRRQTFDSTQDWNAFVGSELERVRLSNRIRTFQLLSSLLRMVWLLFVPLLAWNVKGLREFGYVCSTMLLLVLLDSNLSLRRELLRREYLQRFDKTHDG